MLRSCTDVVARCVSNCDLGHGLTFVKLFTNLRTNTGVDSKDVYSSINTSPFFVLGFHSHAAVVPDQPAFLFCFLVLVFTRLSVLQSRI